MAQSIDNLSVRGVFSCLALVSYYGTETKFHMLNSDEVLGAARTLLRELESRSELFNECFRHVKEDGNEGCRSGI